MIVWDFIAEREGGRRLYGYVPAESAASGVTVYCGIDIGRLTEDERAALTPALAAKLRPYFGLRGDAARRALRKTSLRISAEEGRALTALKARGFLHDIRAHFDPSAKIAFDRLSDGPATAIVSVTWQYGDPWTDAKCGDFWRIACRCDWPALAAYLTVDPYSADYKAAKVKPAYFPDRRFASRRRLEGEFLLQAVNIYGGKLKEEEA